jgi:hypothetical protein
MAPPSPSSISSSGSVSPGVPTADPSPSKPVNIGELQCGVIHN